MTDYIVKQYVSLPDAVNAMVSGIHVLAIDLDDFEKVYDIEFWTYSDLHGLLLKHTLVFIGLIKREDYYGYYGQDS